MVSSTSARFGSDFAGGRIVADSPVSGMMTAVARPTPMPVKVTLTRLPRTPPRGWGGLSEALRTSAGGWAAFGFGGARSTRLAAAD